jgi:hypothetical protein
VWGDGPRQGWLQQQVLPALLLLLPVVVPAS